MKIGWSELALERNESGTHSCFNKKPKKLIPLIEKHWRKRVPGVGRKDLSQVVVVPIKEKNLDKLFSSPWGEVKKVKKVKASVTRRQKGEDYYIEVHAKGTPLPVKCAKVVLYSAATLLENDGQRSGDYDWEIVAVLCGPWEDEPMSPLTMARNFLKMNGGTFAPYTPTQFAESIYFWSQYVKVKK